MYTVPVILVSFIVSVSTIFLAKPMALYVGLVDKPGGRKEHESHVPLVGGLAIFLALSLAWYIAPRLGLGTINSVFAAAGGLIFFVGMLDDRIQLSVWFRFAAQIAAACLLVYSTVVVRDLGYLFGEGPFALEWFAVPVTILAIVGAINAVNMIDGMDGLAGTVSVVSFTLLTYVAFDASNLLQILILLCVLGGLLGFLAFNMPVPGRAGAHIFMGDAGSTLLGLLLANSLIVLSQGDSRAMAPVTALWIFAVPLLDTLGVMLRRLWLGRSPFSADRGHIHHLLLDAGFRVRHCVLLIALLQGLLGVFGLILDRAGVPELISLLLFGLLFAAYFYLLRRPTRAVPAMRSAHRKAGWIVQGVEHIYVAGLDPASAISDMYTLLGVRAGSLRFELYRLGERADSPVYALIEVGDSDKVRKVLDVLKFHMMRKQRQGHPGLVKVTELRQFIPRAERNERRANAPSSGIDSMGRHCKRKGDRRTGLARMVYRSLEVDESEASQSSCPAT